MNINQPVSLQVGTKVNERYVVTAVVGRGGLGTVYRVLDEWQNPMRTYALKETIDLSDGAREQFMREARWLQQLDHPNIPRVLHHFQWHDRLYLVMDFVSGENLEQKLIRNEDRPLYEQEVIAWLLPICDALAHLHEQNPQIVHRDVKPANIIVTTRGYPALVDLGIAKEHLPGMRNITATFIRKAGTEGYAPPEQYISNGTTGPWSDIYSLGATMYHLLTGQIPATAVERAALDGQLIPPRSLNPNLSARTETVIIKCLAIRPQDRFASMREVIKVLREDPAARSMGGAGVSKLPSKPICPRCGRPMASPASLCTVCASELALRADAALQTGPAVAAMRSSHPVGTGQYAATQGFEQMASTPHTQPFMPGNRMPSHPMATGPSSSMGPAMAQPVRRAIQRPRRLTRNVPRQQSAVAATATNPGAIPITTARRSWPWRSLMVAILALTILGGGFMVGSRFLSLALIDQSSPHSTVVGFFDALKSQDYQKAYSYFSPQADAQISYNQFVKDQTDSAQQQGVITRYAISGTTTLNNATLQITVRVSRGSTSDIYYTVQVSSNGDHWQIDSFTT